MNVVIPAAGRGSRFLDKGITIPKPLISISGKPMVRWAVESLPFVKPSELIFVLRREHVDNYEIDKRLKEIFSPAIKVIVIDYVTEGAACTILLAKGIINNNEPLIVSDCDHYFRNSAYNRLVTNTPEGISGVIPVFKAEGTKWSFTRFNEGHVVAEVAEKVRISDYANIGAYFFARGKDFVAAAEEMVQKNLRVNNEFYVAPVYNLLLGKGAKVLAAECEAVWGLGTPEDVALFEKNYRSDLY